MRRTLANRFKECRRGEDGVVLVFVAICMVFLLAIAGLAIDIGSWYQTHRQAQAAADAAVLAGVQDLPGRPATASSDAQSYVNQNIAGATTTITTPYNSSSSEIQVTVSVPGAIWFAGIVGIKPPTITATAAAKRALGPVPAAAFASNQSCSGPGVSLAGNNNTVLGAIHSNGALDQTGNNDTFGETTYGGPNSCSATTSGKSTFAGAAAPTVDPGVQPWPQDFTSSSPACTFTASSFSFTTNHATIPPGVYCASSGSITVSGQGISGNVTFIAASVSVGGNNLSLTPYASNLLIYQTGTSTLSFSGNDLNGGTIFAPNATIAISGNNGSSGTGFFEGLNVTFSGNNWNFTGTGPPVPGAGGSLVQ